jgi:hypothetical protein
MDIPMGAVDRLPWVICGDCTVDCGRRTTADHYCLEYNGPTVPKDYACVPVTTAYVGPSATRTPSDVPNDHPTRHAATSAVSVLERF